MTVHESGSTLPMLLPELTCADLAFAPPDGRRGERDVSRHGSSSFAAPALLPREPAARLRWVRASDAHGRGSRLLRLAAATGRRPFPSTPGEPSSASPPARSG